jgi:hypothetical protein
MFLLGQVALGAATTAMSYCAVKTATVLCHALLTDHLPAQPCPLQVSRLYQDAASGDAVLVAHVCRKLEATASGLHCMCCVCAACSPAAAGQLPCPAQVWAQLHTA